MLLVERTSARAMTIISCSFDVLVCYCCFTLRSAWVISNCVPNPSPLVVLYDARVKEKQAEREAGGGL